MFRYFVSIVLFLSFFYSISSADLSEGLIGYWKFDEGGGDEVKDISGEDHHGKLVSGKIKWIDGKEKKAIYFSGTEKAPKINFCSHQKDIKSIFLEQKT